eukprot:CAMPEP_0168266454 /NCGR_PEP_ID=MMETSP0141_2-20121125/12477_1 /TAXON_ID=44445 /ORGANISM="Pseudo-nitzschia australis, Strain 10249 10 AB" /LENGTH=173 /DNA_ID=CAMNT_0008206383 /DNA_START=224 /DNA_END=744 /DNA_ORIENTATION=+
MIGTGFSFEDGEQILVSVQKPFGIVLEQGGDTNSIDENATNDDQIVVTEVDPNGSVGRAGVRTGDVLVAVQNASTISADLTEVLDFIANKCPAGGKSKISTTELSGNRDVSELMRRIKVLLKQKETTQFLLWRDQVDNIIINPTISIGLSTAVVVFAISRRPPCPLEGTSAVQ